MYRLFNVLAHLRFGPGHRNCLLLNGVSVRGYNLLGLLGGIGRRYIRYALCCVVFFILRIDWCWTEWMYTILTPMSYHYGQSNQGPRNVHHSQVILLWLVQPRSQVHQDTSVIPVNSLLLFKYAKCKTKKNTGLSTISFSYHRGDMCPLSVGFERLTTDSLSPGLPTELHVFGQKNNVYV